MTESKRLIFRSWYPDDAAALYKYASDRMVSELAMWPCHDSVEMSREVIETVFMPHDHTFAVVLKQTDEPVGCIGLVPEGAENYSVRPKEREVGYWIGHPYWGKGLTTEALEWLIGYCRDTMRLQSLLITTDIRNAASQRVAEKCGFQFVEDFKCGSTTCRAYRNELADGDTVER